MNPILEQFLIEARENLLYLDKNLENLDSGDKEIVNALFRAAHTLKGSSGLAGFDAVKQATHIAEDLLDAYRNDKLEFSSELLDALYDIFDEVTELVDATEESGEVVEIHEDKIEEFKLLRSEILNTEEEVEAGLNTELIIADDEIPAFAHFFKNDFNNIDLNTLPLDIEEITIESFEAMNYYIIDIDLSSDTLEIGNDPMYSTYLLENENILSIYTQVSSSCEDIKENPLNWVTRIVAIVQSNQELLEDAFFNFMDEVTVYPLCIKSLFNSDLQMQSNDSIQDFLIDLQAIKDENRFDKLSNSLSAVLDIVNPQSLQGFLFFRLKFIVDEFNLEDEQLNNILEFVFNLLNLEKSEQIEQEQDIEEEIVLIEQDEEIELASEESIIPIEDEIEQFDFDLDKKKAQVLKEILIQQKTILETVNNDNVVTQVKSILSNLETNLNKDFLLENRNDKESLLKLIDVLIDSILPLLNEEIEEEIIIDNPVLEETSESVDEPIPVKKELEKKETNSKPKKTKEKKTSKPMAKTVKIDLSDIDSMMDIVGEMLVIKNSLPYIADGLTSKNIELSQRELMTRYDEINRVTTQLQEKVMEMRLLSLSFIFDRYPKLVRDISKSLGKKIKYNEDGGDTKLDKTIIEKLADPLVHIIRNSLDHGIETPEDRKEKGKDPEGNITISAQSIGDKVYVTIEDDGKGIDVDKVVRSSLEKKMVDPDKLDEMSEEEKLLLVFHPGVSTMDQVSELSGRGVGMDVVRQTIDDIGGKISISSTIDVGTKLTLELPMSVALTNVFHVKLAKSNYALSMDTITETVQVAKDEVEYVNRKPMLKLRGNLVPLVFNYNLLSKDIGEKENYSLLIIETQGTKFGFVVDKFVNQLDIIQKPLSSNFKNHPFISGTSLLGNGEVLFVINPYKLINLKEKK